MSTELMRLPAADHWTAIGAGAAATVAALIRGIGSRLATRRRREEDAVARLIAAHGGLLTDDLERRISARLMGGGLT